MTPDSSYVPHSHPTPPASLTPTPLLQPPSLPPHSSSTASPRRTRPPSSSPPAPHPHPSRPSPHPLRPSPRPSAPTPPPPHPHAATGDPTLPAARFAGFSRPFFCCCIWRISPTSFLAYASRAVGVLRSCWGRRSWMATIHEPPTISVTAAGTAAARARTQTPTAGVRRRRGLISSIMSHSQVGRELHCSKPGAMRCARLLCK